MASRALHSAELRKRVLRKSVTDSPAAESITKPLEIANSTPVRDGLAKLRQRLDEQLESNRGDAESKTSPTLAKLRMTPVPGKILKEKQQVLIGKHEEVRNQADKLNIGGGVSLWPAMEDMRLSEGDTMRLIIISFALFFGTVILFHKVHGSLWKNLWKYEEKLINFYRMEKILIDGTNEAFAMSLRDWHYKYRDLLDELKQEFSISTLTVTYGLYITLYLLGMSMLLYYLLDNMFATSKLSPRRIKKWVCLLIVIGTWTILMAYTLMCAQRIEYNVERNVHKLSEYLGDLVGEDVDLTQFNTVLTYWRLRCLPPTTQGVLSILGVLPVRDVTYYLQYYSLPILTVLVTPIFKLAAAFYNVYAIQTKR